MYTNDPSGFTSHRNLGSNCRVPKICSQEAEDISLCLFMSGDEMNALGCPFICYLWYEVGVVVGVDTMVMYFQTKN